jgi:hypothetical protein
MDKKNHWVNKYGSITDLEEISRNYNWSIDYSTEEGPVYFNSNDGSQCTIHQGGMVGTVVVQYEPEEGTNKVMASESDRRQAYNASKDGFESVLEWLEHYMKKHNNKN